MKTKFTIGSIILSATMLLSASAFADKLRVGVEGAYPPFSSVNKDGKLEGFDIEIAQALCADMGVECNLIKQDWDGIIPDQKGS